MTIGLKTVGLMTIGLMAIGLMTVGLMTIELMTIGLMIVGLMTNAGFTYLWALGQAHQWAPKFIEMLACFSIQYIYIRYFIFFLNGQMSTKYYNVRNTNFNTM